METFDTHTLLGAIKKAGIKFDPLFLRLFFPHVYTFATKKIMLDRIPVDTPMALYCAPKVAGKIVDDQGFETDYIEPPYIKPKHEVDLERELKRRPGESPVDSPMSPEDRREAIIMENLALEEKAITQREEFQAVEAVISGKITAKSARHPELVIDMGRNPANNITLTGAARWSQQDKKTFNPDDQIEEWSEKADGAIDLIVMDKKSYALYRSFEAIKNNLDSRRGSKSELEIGLKDLGKAVSYKGTTGTGVHIIVYSGEYIPESGGTKQKYMPDNTVVMGHTAVEGLRLYGSIQNQKAIKDGLSKTSRYPRNWLEEGDPSGEYTQTETAPAMFLTHPNEFVVAVVD